MTQLQEETIKEPLKNPTISILNQPKEIIQKMLFSLEYSDIIAFYKTNHFNKDVVCTEAFWKDYVKIKLNHKFLEPLKSWKYLAGILSLKITENLDLKKLSNYYRIYKNPKYILKVIKKYFVEGTIDTSVYAQDYRYNNIPIKTIVENIVNIIKPVVFSKIKNLLISSGITQDEIINYKEIYTDTIRITYQVCKDLFQVFWTIINDKFELSFYREEFYFLVKTDPNGKILFYLDYRLENPKDAKGINDIYFNIYTKRSNEEFYGVEEHPFFVS